MFKNAEIKLIFVRKAPLDKDKMPDLYLFQLIWLHFNIFSLVFLGFSVFKVLRVVSCSKSCVCVFGSSEGWGRSIWGPNVQEFRQRFDTAETKGEGTRRLKNLYFLYLIELRALSKVSPYFERAFVNLYTGNRQEDGNTKELLLQFFDEIK